MTRIVFAVRRKDGTYRYRDAFLKQGAPDPLPPECDGYVKYRPEQVMKYSGSFLGMDGKFHTGRPYSRVIAARLVANLASSEFKNRYATTARQPRDEDEEVLAKLDAQIAELRRARSMLLGNAYANGAPVWEGAAEEWDKPAEGQGDSDA